MHYSIQKFPQSLIKIRVELSVQESEGSEGSERVLKDLFLKTWRDIQAKEALIVLTPPEFILVSKKPVKFEIEFTNQPKIKVATLEEMKTASPKNPPITEKEINYVMDELRRSRAHVISKQGPAQKGDRVVVAYEGRDEEGVVQMAAKDKTIDLGSGGSLPGFEQALIGMKGKESKSFKIQFPKDYFEKKLANKTLNFKVTVNDVEIVKMSPLDEVFAAQIMGEGKTVKDLKKRAKEGLEKHQEEKAKSDWEAAIFDKIIEKTQIEELPETLIQGEIDRLLTIMYHDLKGKKVEQKDFENYLKKEGRDPRKQLREQAKRSVIFRLALEELFKQKECEVTEDEIDVMLSKEIMQLPPDEQDEARGKVKNDKASRDQLKKELQLNKLIHYLKN